MLVASAEGFAATGWIAIDVADLVVRLVSVLLIIHVIVEQTASLR